MRIAFIGSHERSLVNFRRTLIEQLQASGGEALAVSWSQPGSQAAELRALASRAVYLGAPGARLSPLLDLVAIFRLFWTFVRNRPDCALVFAGKPIGLGSLVCMALGIPTVVLLEGKGSGFLKPGLVKRANSMLFQLAFRGAASVLVLNKDDRDWVRELMASPQFPVELLPGIGVELDRFSPNVPVPSSSFRVLFLGRLARSKGLEVLIRAFAKFAASFESQASSERGKPTLSLYGPPADGEDALSEAQIKQIAAQHGEEIAYHGSVSHQQIPEVIAAHSIVVVPSISAEGLPATIQEAFAAGRPVIATDVVGSRDAMALDQIPRDTQSFDHPFGAVVPPDDVDALASALGQANADLAVLQAKGQAARAYAAENYARHKVDTRLLDYLRQAAAGQ